MPRFILRYRGSGPMPGADVDAITRAPGLEVIDGSSPRMLLVEARREDVEALLSGRTDWIVAPERTVTLPDPRPKLGPGE